MLGYCEEILYANINLSYCITKLRSHILLHYICLVKFLDCTHCIYREFRFG